ncbi:ABC transporter ATP-binding protein [soil metagenome]
MRFSRHLPIALRKPGWAFGRWREVVAAIWPFARRHRWSLALGGLSALFVIGIRLSIPFLFKQMLKPLLTGSHHHRALTDWLDSSEVEPTLVFGGLFLLLLVALGFADFFERLKFAQFAIGTVRDLRAKAFQSALRIDPSIRLTGPGELVARLIGDTARVKEGMKGFLVHVATNGGLFIGATTVLIWVNPLLGSIFAVAFLLIVLVTVFGTTRVYHRAMKFRSKEGRLAESISRAWTSERVDDSFAAVNQSSGEHEATVTRIQGQTTWAAHAIFGMAVLLLVWLGMRSVANRTISSSDLLVFILYALMTRSPLVQLTRQGTRTGKILACADRLEQVLRSGEQIESLEELLPLQQRLRINAVRVVRSKSQGRVRRLRIGELDLAAGRRVVIIGAAGAGKSTLLDVLSGQNVSRRGQVFWDDRLLAPLPARARGQQIALLAQCPSWPKQRLWQFLGLADATLPPDLERLFGKLGVTDVLSRLPAGLNSKLSSEMLAAGERRVLALAGACLKDPSLLLLDDPTVGLSRGRGVKRLKTVFKHHQRATIVVAMNKLIGPQLFDRVVKLRRGKIVFDGTPQEFADAQADRSVVAVAPEASEQPSDKVAK